MSISIWLASLMAVRETTACDTAQSAEFRPQWMEEAALRLRPAVVLQLSSEHVRGRDMDVASCESTRIEALIAEPRSTLRDIHFFHPFSAVAAGWFRSSFRFLLIH